MQNAQWEPIFSLPIRRYTCLFSPFALRIYVEQIFDASHLLQTVHQVGQFIFRIIFDFNLPAGLVLG